MQNKFPYKLDESRFNFGVKHKSEFSFWQRDNFCSFKLKHFFNFSNFNFNLANIELLKLRELTVFEQIFFVLRKHKEDRTMRAKTRDLR